MWTAKVVYQRKLSRISCRFCVHSRRGGLKQSQESLDARSPSKVGRYRRCCLWTGDRFLPFPSETFLDLPSDLPSVWWPNASYNRAFREAFWRFSWRGWNILIQPMSQLTGKKGYTLNQEHVHGRQVLSTGHIQVTTRIFWSSRCLLSLQPFLGHSWSLNNILGTFLELSRTFSVIHFLNVVDIYWPSRHLSTL